MNTLTALFTWLGALLAPVKAWIIGSTICTSNLNGLTLVILGSLLGIVGFIGMYLALSLITPDTVSNQPRKRPGME